MNNLVDCRDRTAEFFSTVQQIQKAQHASMAGASGQPAYGAARPAASASGFGSSGSNFHSEFDERPDEALLGAARGAYGQPAQPRAQQSQFTQAASHIGQSIHGVTLKLEKLAKLARQRSLFNDPAQEINELTFVIKDDIGTLQSELEKLAGWVTAQRAASTSSTSHGARHSTAVVDGLKQELMRTTKSFQEVLQVRTQTLKEQHQRRKQFEASGGASAAAGGSSSNNHSHGGGDTEHASSSYASSAPSSRGGAHSGLTPVGNAAVKRRGANAFDALMSAAAASAGKGGAAGGPSSAAAAADFEATSHDDAELSFITPAAGGMGGLQSQQQAQQAAQDQTDEYLSSRARAVEDIESTIAQLGGMYSRLVGLLAEQGEVAVTIDSNMDDALAHMESGHSELLKFYDNIKGGKWLIIKVFAVLLAFLIFFMIFVA